MKRKKPTTGAPGSSSPHPLGFLCTGERVNGEFIPKQVHPIANSLEAEELVQAFLRAHSLSEPPEGVLTGEAKKSITEEAG